MSIRKIDHTYIKTRGANTNDILRVVGTELQYVSANSVIYANILPLLSVKANIADLTTANIIELNNLYYTNTRVYSNVVALLPTYTGNITAGNTIIGSGTGGSITGANLISANYISATNWLGLYTANIIESQSALYYTNARVYSNVAPLLTAKANIVDLTTANVVELNNLYYTNTRVYSNVAPLLAVKANVVDLTTSNVVEGNNLYYTNARVYANVTERLLNVDSNIIPAADELYNLGSPTRKFKDLYLSGTTLTLGSTQLSSSAEGLVVQAIRANVWNNLYTANVVETQGNLYYTNARVRSTLSSGTGVIYDKTTGQISIGQNVDTQANVTFNNMTITGNLNVVGNLVGFYANTLVVTDPLIELGYNNPSDSISLGFIGHYNDGMERHAGLFRDATDKKFKFFDNYNVAAGGVTINTANSSFRLANVVATTFEGNLIGNVTGFVSSIANFTTSALAEGTNLYYTNARVDSFVTPKLTTANVTELNNLYYTNARVYSNVAPLLATKANVVDLTTANVVELNNLYYTNSRVYSNVINVLLNYATNANLALKANIVDLTTANVTELNNLYYTNARVYSNVIGLLNAKANVVDLTTANVVELNNLYYTNSRVYTNILALLPTLAGNNIIIAANGQISANLLAASGGTASSVLASGVIGLNTANVNEFGSNLYYTNARVYSNVFPLLSTKANVVDLTTANVVELNNLYYTNARVQSNVTGILTSYATTANLALKANIVDLTTANVAELNNLYYTNSRVYSNVISVLPNYAGNISAGNAIVGTIISGAGGGGSLTGANLISTNNISAINWQGLYTANVIESQSALYYTNARVYANILALLPTLAGNNIIISANGQISANLLAASGGAATSVLATGVIGLNTANVNEFGSNLYYTNARVFSNVSPLLATKANVVDLTTANVVELNNLYYTNSRVYSNVISILPTYAGNISAGNAIVGTIISGAGGGGSLTGANLISTNNISAINWQGLYSANVIESQSALFFSNARMLAGLAGQNLDVSNVIIRGDLIVEGNTVTLNTGTLVVEDRNIMLANGATSSATADGAGINIQGAQANLTYRSTGDKFEFNKPVDILGTLNANTVYANIWNNLYTNNVIEGTSLFYTNARVYSNVISVLLNYATNANLALKANVVDLTTANVTELNNLYYTNSRVYANVLNILSTYTGNIAAGNVTIGAGASGGTITGANVISTNTIIASIWTGLYTANVVESPSALYYTNSRVYSNVIALLQTLAGNNIIIAANGQISANLLAASGGTASAVLASGVVGLNTANVPEFGTNIYYSNARVNAQVQSNLALKANIVDLTTANVAELNNLYYTNARVYSNVISALGTYSGNLSAGNLSVGGSTSGGTITGANVISTNTIIASIWTGIYTANVVELNNLYYTNARVYSNVFPLLATKANVLDLTTANVVELNNLYYTNTRVQSNVISILVNYATTANLALKANIVDLTTANVIEVGNNIFYTNSRVYANVISLLPTYAGNLAAGNLAISGGVGGSLTGANLISANNLSATNWLNLYTANVVETAGNLYFTNARVYANVIALLPSLAGNNIIIAANGQISANLAAAGGGAASSVLATGVVGLNTANVPEFGTNIYYSNARVYSNVFPLLALKANVVDLTTSNVIELTSLYYTNSRVYSNVIALLPTYSGNLAAGNLAISGGVGGSLTGANLISANNLSATNWLNLYTANVIETASNLYFTNARVYANVIGLLNAKANVVDLTTANVIELGSNLYFTNTRARATISAGTGVSYDNTTGIISISQNVSSTANVTFANLIVTGTLTGNLVGNVTGFVSSISNFTTSNLNEGTNLYYTNTRVYSNVIALLPTLAGSGITISANGQISSTGSTPSAQAIIGLNTANVNEFGSNLYYTNTRVYANVITLLQTLAGSNIVIAANGQISANAIIVPGPNSIVILSNSKVIPTLTSQTSYMMTANVTRPENILVILNGITQRPGVDYNVNNTTLTFTSPPPNGNVEIRSFGEQATGFISAANVTSYISNSRTYVGGNLYYNLGSNVALARNIIVTLDGLTLIPDTDYTVNGSNLTLIGGSSTNSSLEVKFFGAEAYNPIFTASIVTAALGSGISGNILPSANMVYNLGSPTLRWKDLYLSGNTINLDGVTIKNDGGTIKFTDVNGTTSASSAAKAIGYSLIFGG